MREESERKELAAIREDARRIADEAILAVLPDQGVRRALKGKTFAGRLVLIAIGKAAWRMAQTAREVLGDQIRDGVVITKYGHAEGPIPGLEIVEAGHPVLDENGILGSALALRAVKELSPSDTVLLLISGGGSALFEKPVEGLSLAALRKINEQLLACGANIVEINAVRKHLSQVKGGRFAQACAPAKIFSIVLSDVLSDRLDTIASGPAYPDESTSEEALSVIKKYGITIDRETEEKLMRETPKALDRCETVFAGNVDALCEAASRTAERLGYAPLILTSTLDCEAREAGRFFASIARSIRKNGWPLGTPCAVIAGGETVVRLTGSGLGGRNQEMALAACEGMAGLAGAVFCSVGSDGTDGPTGAAGGLVDGTTAAAIREAGLSIDQVLSDNDSYHALERVDGLIATGPTGTNVNDLQLLLIR